MLKRGSDGGIGQPGVSPQRGAEAAREHRQKAHGPSGRAAPRLIRFSREKYPVTTSLIRSRETQIQKLKFAARSSRNFDDSRVKMTPSMLKVICKEEGIVLILVTLSWTTGECENRLRFFREADPFMTFTNICRLSDLLAGVGRTDSM